MTLGGIFLLVIAFGIIYIYFKRKYNYWSSRGVPTRKPIIPFGNTLDLIFHNANLSQYFANLCNEFDAPFVGFYALSTPHLLIKDPDLIKTVLIKEFNTFADKSFFVDEKIDPILSNTLVGVNIPRWYGLRKKLSPVFSSGKMKMMTPLMAECGKSLENYIFSTLNKNIDMKDVAGRYTTDIMTSCAFGFVTNSFIERNEFWYYVQLLLSDSMVQNFKSMTYMFAHIIVKSFKYTFFDVNAVKFFCNVFVNTIKAREVNHIKRNDLLDALLEIKKSETDDDNLKLEGERIFAQAIMFLAAGHDSTSTSMAFTLHELSMNQDVQNKLREEILEVIEKHGEVTYQAVQEMKYLHMVVSESLRKYSTVPVINRRALQEYKDPKTGLIIEKGMSIFISQDAMHYNPQYFPNPEKYDPERFNEENKHKIFNYSYLPFGIGPRNCIGDRFALLGSKMGIIYVIKKFRVEPNKNTRHPLIFGRSPFLKSKYGIPLTCKKL